MEMIPLPHDTRSHPGLRVSIGIAIALLFWDVVLTGSFLASFYLCPIWCVFSMAKNAIQRPGWTLAILRIAIPALTLALIVGNSVVQYRIGEANAEHVVAACERFYAANDTFPKTLNELVPRYMPSIPRAKYCIIFGEFVYFNLEGRPLLFWYAIPPFGRKSYDFDNRRWRYID